METPKPIVTKLETSVSGVRVQVNRMNKDTVSVQIIGNQTPSEELDTIAVRVSELFGATYESPDHPGTGHIRLLSVHADGMTVEKAVAMIETLA